MSLTRIDVEAALRGLKDFQRRTVDYVFRRMYLDAPAASRFLIADEVGLGKTLVARGIIAKAVEHLRLKGVQRIDVLYICSNASIAQQNLNKLNVTDQRTSSFATRLTLLPLQLKDFKKNRINFVSFTPSTTFDLKSSGGRSQERALIYQMIDKRLGVKSRLLFRILQGHAKLPAWRWWARKQKHEYDRALANQYVGNLKADVAFMKRLENLCERFVSNKRVGYELRREQFAIIGELRRRLADVCIDALEPDLVVLDEFQRFKDLLHGEDDAADLAQRLFRHPKVRILLLSATPYRMLSMDHEVEDDHYTDFLETLRFLFDGDEAKLAKVGEELRRFRQALYGLEPDAAHHAKAARDHLEGLLRSVIASTERIDMTRSGNAMVVEHHNTVKLTTQDLRTARFVDRVARCVEAGDTIEYWKSSPYLVNFMDNYELKRKLLEKCGKSDADLHATFQEAAGQLLSNSHIQRYRKCDPANPRLRALMDATVSSGQWRWLWLPPALPYIAPRGVYAQGDAATKALIFSNWQVVPDSIAALCSYEAERRMLEGVRSPPKYHLLHRQRRPLLQLRLDAIDKRPASMPALALVYPCATLSDTVDPLRLAIELGGGVAPSVEQVREVARARIARKLAALHVPVRGDRGRPDEKWYWAAPALLDGNFAKGAVEWVENKEDGEGFAAALVSDEEEGVGDALRQHVDLFSQTMRGRLDLGPQPEDLVDVLVELALAGPGICALRAMQRVVHDLSESSPEMLTAATTIANGLRSQFNHPEVTAMIQAEDEKTPYWRRVLAYGIEGNLQAVLDEYAHILKESQGLSQRSDNEIATGVAAAMTEALTLRTSTLHVDDFKATNAGNIRVQKFSMRSRFALRFGDVRDDGGKTLIRSGSVRQAFNSPFRPFILASTSVGQEGLDFHQYCHVVYHWNLPSNPVDLEQREGRVNRYKGHAVRRNVAKAYGLSALSTGKWTDPWNALFARAADDRPAGVSELVPYWLFETEGGHSIERRVPVLPLTREVAQYRKLKAMLAIYRLAFGQPRQEDLLCYLTSRSQGEKEPISNLRLRLTPPPV